MLSKAQLTERNRQIVDLLRETTRTGKFYSTLQEIGDTYSITRERVRQIGAIAGVPSRTKVNARERQAIRDNAPECTVEHCSNKVKVIEFPSLRYSAYGRCADHGRDVVLITCAECGKESERERYNAYTDHRIKTNSFRTKPQENWFCNNICQGKFIGREYGFIAHPENSARSKSKGIMYGVTPADLKKFADEN
jgi:hypothetical protein